MPKRKDIKKIMIIGAGYAVYRINKFADDVNPYNWFNRNSDDR